MSTSIDVKFFETDDVWITEAGNQLRFVERDGRKILQQMWVTRKRWTVDHEWRDVPLVTE